jgi:hypothetical protein
MGKFYEKNCYLFARLKCDTNGISDHLKAGWAQEAEEVAQYMYN